MLIKDLLQMRNRLPHNIGRDQAVSAAVLLLNNYDRGALAVLNEKQELIGIISERDIIRKCFSPNGKFNDLRIKEVMTEDVAVLFPEDTVDYAVSVMQQKHIRHLPVVQDYKVIGMVSMRDLLEVELSEVQAEIRYIGLLPRKSAKPVL